MLAVRADHRIARLLGHSTREAGSIVRTTRFLRMRGRRVRCAGLVAGAVTVALAAADLALAAQPGVTQVSADPYTAADAPLAQHATETEPDSFAWGSTVVTAFQVGRVFDGGATDIGWATSSNGGVSWTQGLLHLPAMSFAD